jgi:rSAM/selenodomain-associated transferase 1
VAGIAPVTPGADVQLALPTLRSPPTQDAQERPAGLAIFVKTPEHSPLKTRLAATIGSAAATLFHRQSAQAVVAVARAAQSELPGLHAYWAVAEQTAMDDPLWSNLPRIAQGDGSLGARMRRVCRMLRDAHERVLLLGADAPQITVADIHAAIDALDNHGHVLGPSVDGGFWLFGTRCAVPTAAWTATPWSQPDTASRFLAALGDAPVAQLRTLRDADTIHDLAPLLSALQTLRDPLPEQIALADWLRDQILNDG